MRLKPTALLLTAGAIVLAGARDASAQLDPLLFLKRTQPNVLVVVETSNRMQRDPSNDYLDANIYTAKGVAVNPWEATLGITSGNTTKFYRRKYVNLQNTDPISSGGDKFSADDIKIIGDLQGTDYTNFDERTRLSIARRAIVAAINANLNVARFGLLKMRQDNAAMPNSRPNEGPVKVTNLTSILATGVGESGTNKWRITRPIVGATPNGGLTTVTAPVVAADAASSNATIKTILGLGVGEVSGSLKALTPGGRDAVNVVDAPIEYMLEDAKKHANDLVNATNNDCRNTAVVMIVGGAEGTTSAPAMAAADRATEFLKLGSAANRRVPIYVIALWPQVTDDQRKSLQDIAKNSGGYYQEITKAMVDAASPSSTQTVPEVVRTINLAVQHAFASQTDFDTAPTTDLPYGPQTEYQVTSPIIGTVNLENAFDIQNLPLPNSRIENPVTHAVVPQRSNMLVTTAFAVPGVEAGVASDGGFRGRLRAFRVYEPFEDSKKPTGWEFRAAGTPLWVASVPSAASRNIYTALPDGTVVPFDAANLASFQAYLNDAHPDTLVDFIRNKPLGAVVSSTPAMMDPPSLDPPPDSTYPAFVDENKGRRAIIWFGANDGMLHAIDARKGVEVWAFIPFNMLPKLKELRSGQPVGDFKYFVDGSPKVADVKIAGKWRTYLIMGQGAGGTFYQTFDVTLDKMADTVAPDSDDVASVLGYFSRTDAVPLKWTFPLYKNFDTTITLCGPATAQYTCWGDIAATAPAVEKSVGETWSDPAVGQIESTGGPYTVLVGSGFFKWSMQQGANRNKAVAGNTFYLLHGETGAVLDSKAVATDGKAETVDNCATAGDCRQLKNALQADPVATGPADSRFITKAYMGDLDGKIWRFDVGLNAAKVPFIKSDATLVYDATASHPNFASMATVNVGGAQQYLFQGTGSDLLPSTGVNQSYKLLVILDGTAKAKAEIPLTITDGVGGDEKVTSFPAVAGDIVFFTTTTYNPTTPCTPYDGTLYAFTFVGGPAYDTNRDGKFDAKTDKVQAKTVAGKRASAPFIVDQHVVFAAGDKIEVLGDQKDFNNGVGQAGVRILTWREVR